MAPNYHSVGLMAILFMVAATTQGAVTEPEDWVQATFYMTGTTYTDALATNTSQEYIDLKTKIEDTIAKALTADTSTIVAVNLIEAVHNDTKATVTVSVGLTGVTDKTTLTDTVDAALKAIASGNDIDSATIVVTAQQTTTVDPNATTAAPGGGGGGSGTTTTVAGSATTVAGSGTTVAGSGTTVAGSGTTVAGSGTTVAGSAGGTTVAGSAGGTTAAGSAGGTTAAGSAGGTTAAGSAGGTTAAGSAGGTTAAAGSSSGGGGGSGTTGPGGSGGSGSGGTTGTAGSTGSGGSGGTSSSPPKKVDEDITKGDVSLVDEKEGFVTRAPRTSYFLTVTVPAFIGVLFLIILLLCCTTADSCLCTICSSDPKNVP